jgi:hypothetical protein
MPKENKYLIEYGGKKTELFHILVLSSIIIV